MKTLPLSELKVVAVLHFMGYMPDHQSEGGAVAEFDLEVLDRALYDGAAFKPAAKCDCCGARLKYACNVVHVPTMQGYNVGRDCAAKIQCLQHMGGAIENLSVTLAERAKCNRNEEAFLAGAAAEVAKAYVWAKTERGGSIARDMVEKLRRWGSLSEAQVAFMVRLHAQHLEKAALAATGLRCPAGKVSLTGTILSLKEQPGYSYGSVEYKIVIDLKDGTKVWGSLPRAFWETAKVGDTIAFSATVTVSDRDPLFGFFKRPTKCTLNGVAPAA